MFSMALRCDTDHKAQWTGTVLQPCGRRGGGVSSDTAGRWLWPSSSSCSSTEVSQKSHLSFRGEWRRRYPRLPAEFWLRLKRGDARVSPRVDAEARISSRFLLMITKHLPALVVVCHNQEEASPSPNPFHPASAGPEGTRRPGRRRSKVKGRPASGG